MLSIVVLSSSESFFERKSKYIAHFTDAEGLLPGAKVIINGLQVGGIDSVEFDPKSNHIVTRFHVTKQSSHWVRANSTIEIATQGVLGDKYLKIQTPNLQEAVLPPNSEVPSIPGDSISQFISKSDQLLQTLNLIAGSLKRTFELFESNNRNDVFFESIAIASQTLASASKKLNRELENIRINQAVKNLNDIFQKINNGTGTLGALVNDASLYDEVRALLGGANRNRIIRNLVRKTIRSTKNEREAEASDSTEQQ